MLLAALFCGAACAPPVAVSPGGPADPPAANTESEVLEETWEAVYIDKSKVGHTHNTVSKVSIEGRDLRQIVSETELSVERFGERTNQKLSFLSIETPASQVVRFSCRMTAGPAEMVVHAEVENEKVEMTSQTLGKKQKGALDWDKSWGGFFAVEQSLRAKPLEPGETRELRALMPDFPFPSVPKMKLEAIGVEPTELLDSTRELLKIKQTIELEGGNKIESLAWTDNRGEALKTQLISGLTQTTYRTTKNIALGKSNPVKFDLGTTSTVHVAQPLRDAHRTQRVVYRARIKEGQAKDTFATGPTQTVKLLDEQTAEIAVRAIRPDQPPRLETPDTPPTADDLAASNLIQSDDADVVELAQAAAPEEKDAWKLALALERHVKKSMKSTNFSQAFATAAETAKSLEGDCTEHAMLLAAVCRARQIPSRVAVGLVYDGKSGFAFHMWTEVWISDRWIPLDATRGDGGIGAAHLKLAHSNLKVSSITTALFPVFNVLGRLELEIVEAE